MRVMAFDIGTNSTLFLIADVTDKNIEIVERGIAGNSLGAEIGDDRRISRDLLGKNRMIIESLVEKGNEQNVERFGGVCTHALRLTVNSEDFLNMAAECGLPMRIVSDEEEAALAWRGVFEEGRFGEVAGLLDLGGGSTELILGSGSSPDWSDSLPFAAVNMTREHFKHDPPLQNEISDLKRETQDRFSIWRGKMKPGNELIGIAGTVTALAAIENRITEYSLGILEGLILTAKQICLLRDRLLTMNFEERLAVPGMPEARASSIHTGALMLTEILNILQISELRVSERGVLFGVVLELSESN